MGVRKQVSGGEKGLAQQAEEVEKRKVAKPLSVDRQCSAIMRRVEDISGDVNAFLEETDMPISQLSKLLKIVDGFKRVAYELHAENEFLRGKVSLVDLMKTWFNTLSVPGTGQSVSSMPSMSSMSSMPSMPSMPVNVWWLLAL